MLTTYDVTAVIAACALLLSLAFWITLKMKWLPELKTSIIKEAPAIGKKTYELIKEDLPDIKEEFKKQLPFVVAEFKKELPDFDNMISKIKEEIKKEIPEIPSMDKIIDDLFVDLTLRLKNKDETLAAFINIISGLSVVKAIEFFETDPHIKKWKAGQISSVVQAIKKEMPDFQPLIDKAKQYGIDIDGTGDGQLLLPENINIEDKIKVKLAFAADKFIDNWIDKIGKKV